MDETAIFLEMDFNITIDFRGNKNIDIHTTDKENYKLTVLLIVCGDRTKLAPLIILKGEPGKTIEINMRKLSFVKNNNMYIYCQKNSWCDNNLFIEWINEIFIKYQNSLQDKVLLIIDKDTSHVSSESSDYFKKNNIGFSLIPPGTASLLQPLDLSVNKIFKDHIRLLFEQNRLLYDNINPRIKLNTWRIDVLTYINKVWNDESYIRKETIVNGFKKEGIVGNSYYSLEEESTTDNYLFD